MTERKTTAEIVALVKRLADDLENAGDVASWKEDSAHLRALIARCEELDRRYEAIKYDPVAGAHLLGLLSAGKGTANDFDTMIDRIVESRRNAGLEADHA